LFVLAGSALRRRQIAIWLKLALGIQLIFLFDGLRSRCGLPLAPLFAKPPSIHKIDILADKLPKTPI
jgi:hypothetical protein